MKHLKYYSSIFLISIVFISCYKAPTDTIYESDLDMVITEYDRNRDYAVVYDSGTFFVSPELALASNVEDVDSSILNDPFFKNAIIGTINAEMQALGYRKIDSSVSNETPDIYIPVVISYISTKGVSYQPIYWGGGGYGWGYPSYGWGGYYYPTYSFVPQYYSYDSGSLLIDWMDLKNARPPNYIIPEDTIPEIDIVWHAGISGLIRNSTDEDRNARVKVAIEQAFRQSSSYLTLH